MSTTDASRDSSRRILPTVSEDAGGARDVTAAAGRVRLLGTASSSSSPSLLSESLAELPEPSLSDEEEPEEEDDEPGDELRLLRTDALKTKHVRYSDSP